MSSEAVTSDETTQLNNRLGLTFLIIDRAAKDLIAADMLTKIMTTLHGRYLALLTAN